MRLRNVDKDGAALAALGWRAASCLCVVALAAGCGRTGPWFIDWSDVAGPGGIGGTGGTSGGGTGGTSGGGTGGGGAPPTCTVDTDCLDEDVCTTDRCVAGRCENVPRDDDDDGYVAEMCGGADCNDLNPNAYPGHPELCSDAADNDCNGVADCFDPVCADDPNCGCVPSPGGEICDNGLDDDCDETVDCNDADCIGTPACGCTQSEAGLCHNGIDDDCDEATDCDDSECSSDPLCLCQGAVEFCDNGQDDDCDLLVDCADADCALMFPCVCIPPGYPENCTDGQDNDCDELVDCADPDCNVAPACQNCVPEICDDGLDNNCNDLIDCADPECYFDAACEPEPEICNNGLDDDNDTLTDCQDPDCANNPYCVQKQMNCLSPRLIPGSGTYYGDTTGNIGENSGSCGGEAGEAVFYFVLTEPSRVHLDSVGTSFDSTLYVRRGDCDYGTEIGCDDDSGGSAWSAKLDFIILYPGTYYVFLDGYTVDPVEGPNEGPFQLNVDIEPNPPELCTDGIDNDGDHYVDCADPECATVPACLNCNAGAPPTAEFGIDACTNGQDDDCDGLVDCDDDDCSASDYYITECCNGMDQNGNQIPDDFNCRCVSDADCAPGEICYTHTAWACGYPCDQFFGQICPFVAPGSYCNIATQQCEY